MDEDDELPHLPQPWLYTGLRVLGCLLLCWAFLAGGSGLSVGITTVLAVLVLVSMLATYELSIRGAPLEWVGGAAFAILGLGLAGYGLWHVTRPPVPIGPLLPANDPTPSSTCREPLGQGDIAMFAGGIRLVMKGAGPFHALTVGACPVLILRRTGQGLMADASYYDWTDDIAFRVARNVFEPLMPLQLRSFRPDPHTLVILDRFDQEVLYLRFLNPHALRLRGRFLCAEQPQIVIRDDMVLRGGVRIGGVFFGQHRDRTPVCAASGGGQLGLKLGAP